VSEWVGLAVPTWAGGAALALLALRGWESSVRPGSLVLEEWHSPDLAGVPGSVEVPGRAEALGPVDGLATDGLAAGAVDVGGHGGVSAQASHWQPPGGRTTAATVMTHVSSGYQITAG